MSASLARCIILELCDCANLADAGLAPLGRLPALTCLDVSQNPQIGDAGMSHPSDLDALRVLNRVAWLTAEGQAKQAATMSALQQSAATATRVWATLGLRICQRDA